MNRQVSNIAEVPGFPDYTFTPDGKVFKKGKPKAVSLKKDRAAQLIIRLNRKMTTLGMAKLIADRWLPNPWNYKRLIYKDRNHHNCTLANIAWVDEETYFYYCCPEAFKGRPKIVHTQDYAAANATCVELKHYYMTFDEYWLAESWKIINRDLSRLDLWPQIMSAVYLHFIDRTKRFSILGNPCALMWYYAKGEISKLKKQVGPKLIALLFFLFTGVLFNIL